MRLIDTLSLWPACFGLPFFGVVIHQFLGEHPAELMCVAAVMLVMGNDGLRFCSVGASLLSCLALCGKLKPAWQMQVFYFGPGHAPPTPGLHNCSEASGGADKCTSKHTCNTSPDPLSGSTCLKEDRDAKAPACDCYVPAKSEVVPEQINSSSHQTKSASYIPTHAPRSYTNQIGLLASDTVPLLISD